MTIDGSAVNIQWGFRPLTMPAIQWQRLADGNWTARDRGASEDVFESDIIFYGEEADISAVETYFHSNRNTVSIACASAGEEIFGADISHSGTLTAIVTSYGPSQRVSFSGFIFPVRLRLVSPSTTGTAAITSLRLAGYKYEAYSEFDLRRFFTYDRTAYHFDGATDPGYFKGVFRQTTSEMQAIRRYLLSTARTASVSFPSFGVSEPFGQRMGTGPFTVKAVAWEDLGRRNFADWELSITFARVIS